MARVKYYDSTTQTWKYADMALQTGIHVGTTAPTNEAMLWVDTASNQIDDFPLTDVKDGDGNSLIASGTTYAVSETPANKLKSVSGGGAGITSASTDVQYPSAKAVYDALPNIPDGTNSGDILVWNGTAWVAKKPSRLPAGFTEVEYIQSDGNQYINTGANPSSNIKIVMELEMPAVTAQSDYYLFGSTRADVNSCYSFGGYNGKYHAEYGIATPYFFTNTSFTGRTQITYDNGLIEITDGTTTETADLSAQTHSTYNRPFYIFATANDIKGGIAAQGKVAIKLYSFELWNGSNAVRCYVPCYHIDTGAIGLYDTVNGVFYQNAGTGTFTKGADVN